MFSSIRASLIGFICLLGTLGTTAGAGTFDIRVLNGGGLSDSQWAAFSQAEATWESLISGTQTSLDLVLTIEAAGRLIDGRGGVLGMAGPTHGIGSEGFLYATTGIMRFDSADLNRMQADGELDAVILHEMAHVMGFGTLWSSAAVGIPGYQEVYTRGSGRYTGVHALSQYRLEFDPNAAFVPVELDFGRGTRDFHWDENWAGGPYALMTGILDSPSFISNTTIASFGDIGYLYEIPLPATLGLLLGGLGLLGRHRVGRMARA